MNKSVIYFTSIIVCFIFFALLVKIIFVENCEKPFENFVDNPQNKAIVYSMYCINLKKRADRRFQMIKTFAKANIPTYNFFDAVDGSTLKLNLELTNLFRNNNFNYRCGVIGCALSHYNLWKKLIADPLSNYYVVFEDDVVFCENFNYLFSDTLAKIPADSDITYLGYTMTAINREKYNHIYKNNTVSTVVVTNLALDIFGVGLFSYVISKKGAEKMVNYIAKYGIQDPIDYVPLKSNLKLYECRPHLVFTESVQNHSVNVDSDIQHGFCQLSF